jgi:hypothetical protein
MNDSSVVMAALLGATTVTYVRDVSEHNPVTIKPVIGMFVAGTLLFAVSIWNGNIAVALAVLIFITSIVLNGAVVFDTIGKVTG